MPIETESYNSVIDTDTPVFERWLQPAAPSWKRCLSQALQTLPKDYVKTLSSDSTWLPGPEKIFNAFSLPMPRVNYILLGESPYPRTASANGYAFWDNAVENLWSPTGLSKEVNRATSLRNLIKMLLIADHRLSIQDTSQERIAGLDKAGYITTGKQLFQNMQHRGVLLLNACLVLSHRPVAQEARYWQPFLSAILDYLKIHHPNVTLILLGNIAKQIKKLPACGYFNLFCAEHPYNLSFISNPEVIEFFKPLTLLGRESRLSPP